MKHLIIKLKHLSDSRLISDEENVFVQKEFVHRMTMELTKRKNESNEVDCQDEYVCIAQLEH